MPGEHDVLDEDGRGFFERFTKGADKGYYSFDQQGVHFVGLNNVHDLKAGGLGNLGQEQLAWLEQDLHDRPASQPIVVFAHIPLWTVYQQWGWGTDDGVQALSYLRRFGSVTVLNGHIHQVMQKVEGNVAFHTALLHGISAARARQRAGSRPDQGVSVRQAALRPGGQDGPAGSRACAPGDRRHAARRLIPPGTGADIMRRRIMVLGVVLLAGGGIAAAAGENATVTIDNFTFSGAQITVPPGTKVTWENRDDIPHTITDAGEPRGFPIAGARHRRDILACVFGAGDVSLFLLAASEDAGNGGGEVGRGAGNGEMSADFPRCERLSCGMLSAPRCRSRRGDLAEG